MASPYERNHPSNYRPRSSWDNHGSQFHLLRCSGLSLRRLTHARAPGPHIFVGMKCPLVKFDYIRTSIAFVLTATVVTGCAPQIAVVSEKPPARFQATAGTNQAVANAIDRAQGFQ